MANCAQEWVVIKAHILLFVSNVHSNLVKDASGTGILLRNSGGSEVFQNSVVTRHRAGLVGIGVEPTRDSGNGESVSITYVPRDLRVPAIADTDT